MACGQYRRLSPSKCGGLLMACTEEEVLLCTQALAGDVSGGALEHMLVALHATPKDSHGPCVALPQPIQRLVEVVLGVDARVVGQCALVLRVGVEVQGIAG